MNGSDATREWAKGRKAKLQPSLYMMEAGRMKTREMRGGAFVDTTEEGKALFHGMIAELDHIIEHGRPAGAERADT
ncbi:MAG: hypothetical protein ICV73_01475 [Acetobacteraceae bacterium]|nr:hypothetical protein [Acetobacteraceae bacterium]